MNLNEVITLGNSLMRQHGLISLGWRFELDNAKKRFGICRYHPKIIGVSKNLASINDELKVKDTILHEIAHALVGSGNGHNWIWKRKCIEVGAKPERCYKTKETNTPQLRYFAICAACGTEHQRVKKVNSIDRHSCRCQIGLPWNLRKILIFRDRFAIN